MTPRPLTHLQARLVILLCAALPGCGPAPASQAAPQQAPGVEAAPKSAAPRLQRGRTLVDAKVMSLQELIQNAHQIFVGRVEKVDETDVSVGEGVSAKGRLVTISVEEALKGPVTNGQSVTVKQLLSISAPLKTGEKILWFLPQATASGLLQPLGIYSGDFRINTEQPDAPATNLKLNAGLWDGSLWQGDGFDQASVMAEGRRLGMSNAQVQGLARAAAAGPEATTVPLSLLVAAIRSEARQ